MTIRPSLHVWVFLLIALLTVLLAGPLWQISGIPMVTNDAAAHTHRSAEVYRAFEQGVYWPRWFPLVYNGLGAPTFHHYSPGLYWLVAAIHQAGIGLDQALKLVLTGVFALSGLSGYAWLRHAFSPPASMTGVALYLFYPYVWTRSLYFVGDHPQLMGLLLLPVCLWAFTALHMRGRLRNWIAASVSLTALVYCHNMTAMFGAAVLLINWLLLAVGYRRRDGLLRCALAALLAALLSAGFWLPALADLSHVQIENGRTGFFHFSNHFLDWRRLFSYRSPLLDSRDGNPLRSPVTFGAATWLALAAGLISVRFVTQRERPLLGSRWRPLCPGNAHANPTLGKTAVGDDPAAHLCSVSFSIPGNRSSRRIAGGRPWLSTRGLQIAAGCRASRC